MVSKVVLHFLDKGNFDTIIISNQRKKRILAETAGKESLKRQRDNREAIRLVGTKHLQAAIKSINNLLATGGVTASITAGLAESGLTQDSTGTPRTINFVDGNGKRHRATTPEWRPLNKKYAARTPKSRQFWRKGIDLSSKGIRLSDIFQKATHGKHATARAEKGGGLIKSTPTFATVRTVTRLGVQKMPWPYDRLIGAALLSGKRHDIRLPGVKIDTTGPERAVYPEIMRPMISVVAAGVHKYLIKDLRKIK